MSKNDTPIPVPMDRWNTSEPATVAPVKTDNPMAFHIFGGTDTVTLLPSEIESVAEVKQGGSVITVPSRNQRIRVTEDIETIVDQLNAQGH